MAEKKRTFRTTKVLSGVKTEYHAWKEWEEGDTLIAKLVGTSPNRKAKGKVDWIVECQEPMFADKAQNKRLHGPKDEKSKGVRLTLNCAGQFDKGMAQLSIGDLFQVVYNGSKEMEGGDYEGQMAHTMEVEGIEEFDENDSAYDEDEADDEDTDDL